MEDPIRCPYCVYRDEFKIMISLGTCFVCEKCGHIVALLAAIFKCQVLDIGTADCLTSDLECSIL